MNRYEGSPAIVIERRKGTPDSPFSDMNESLVVASDGKVVLSEIPNELNRVIVTSEDNTTWYEITNGQVPLNGFKVDYINKLVTFNIANVGKQLHFKYYGEGNHYYSLHSIYTRLEDGSVVETLGNLIENGTDALDALDKLDEKLNEITQATENAITATNDTRNVIIEGNQIIDTANTKIANMDSKIDEVTSKITELDSELDEARTTIMDVQQKSTVVEGIITEGQDVINNAQLLIDEVKSVGIFNLATSYKKNNTVLDKGSTWIALQDTQNNPLPVLPVTENMHWRLIALQGSKGEKGETGAALSIQGSLTDPSQLPSTGQAGQAYTINGELYVWSENTNSWENVGNVKGEKGDIGEDGLSAYEIAVNNGFVGSTEEWLTSLKGEKGEKGQDADLTEVNQEIADLQQTVSHNHQEVNDLLTQIAFTNINEYNGTDTQKLNAFLTAHAGKTIRIPRGYYNIDAPLNIHDDTFIEAEGVVIKANTHFTMLEIGENVKINGIEIIGATNSVYNQYGIGISFKGTVSKYKRNLKLENCKINNLGCYGIYLEYAQGIEIVNCDIDLIGYAGILGMSVKDVLINQKTTIKNINPGSSSNMYGIAFTRNNASSDLSQFPRSENCIVDNCIIENVISWEALDTHGGNNIKFINNTIKNCKTGIAIVNSSSYISPNYCVVSGNTIYGQDGGTGIGIVVQGSPNMLGNPYSYAESCLIKNNTLINCGLDGTSESGAIFFEETRGILVNGNIIEHAYGNAINCYVNNQGFNISNNTIKDPQSSTIPSVSGICVRTGYSKGYIGDNTLLKANNALNTFVAEYGVWVASQTETEIVLGSNFNNFEIEQVGTLGQAIKRNPLYNGIYTFIGSESPEAIISAKVGSEYIDINTGKKYLKKSGTGSTGWLLLG